MALRRGFKSEAERIANRVRSNLGSPADSSVTPQRLAKFLGVEVRAGDDLIDRNRFEELDGLQEDAFSACTLKPTEDRTVVVLNPLSTPGRQASDLAHELAHLLLDHELSSVEKLGGSMFLTCDAVQEEEANWLSGCLLLPRELLLKEVWKSSSAKQIATKYRVSEDMARFRLNATGVLRQKKAWIARRGARR